MQLLSYNCDNVGLVVQCQLFAGISSSEQELLIEEKNLVISETRIQVSMDLGSPRSNLEREKFYSHDVQ